MRTPITMPLERLYECLSYMPETGDFIWLKMINGRSMPGNVAGRTNWRGYRQITLDGKMFLSHRLAWAMHYGEWPPIVVDHIDGDVANNRIANLRLATDIQSAQNRFTRRPRASSGHTGLVYRCGKYYVYIGHNCKQHYLGSYADIEEALEVRHLAESMIFGEFARVRVEISRSE